MLRPAHNLIASGTGGVIVAPQSVSNLTYQNWYIGINSIIFLNCPLIDVCAAISTSLVQKNIAHYFGVAPATTYEPLHVVRIYNAAKGKHYKLNTDTTKLFLINNIGHQVSFHLHNLSVGDATPFPEEEGKTLIHYSLYYLK
jgi:hypothetical protein